MEGLLWPKNETLRFILNLFLQGELIKSWLPRDILRGSLSHRRYHRGSRNRIVVSTLQSSKKTFSLLKVSKILQKESKSGNSRKFDAFEQKNRWKFISRNGNFAMKWKLCPNLLPMTVSVPLGFIIGHSFVRERKRWR